MPSKMATDPIIIVIIIHHHYQHHRHHRLSIVSTGADVVRPQETDWSEDSRSILGWCIAYSAASAHLLLLVKSSGK